MRLPSLTLDHADQYRESYKSIPGWGNAYIYPLSDLIPIDNLITRIRPSSILDFGCGTGSAIARLHNEFPDIHIDGYDPVIPAFIQYPTCTYDLVMCAAVLHLIDDLHMPLVVSELTELTSNYLFLLIRLTPAIARTEQHYINLFTNIFTVEYMQVWDFPNASASPPHMATHRNLSILLKKNEI